MSDADATRSSDSAGTSRPAIADTIEGYEIRSEIHRGGQGVVYKAIQKATKRTVALKVLIGGPYASRRQRHRFEREIDLVASLHHPHIVTIYDSGVTRDDRHYFAMEYIRSLPLDAYLSDKNLSIDATLRLFRAICAAVNYAHQRGVIHRDLKPANIRIDAEGQPHILDFGLAKVAGTDLTQGAPMTVTGEFMGTLAYASPEQTRGDPNLIDIRTDVYSLGVILHEMLTGKYPYPVVGQMADVLKNIAEAVPNKPSTIRRQVNDEVETIALRCLQKQRERRYQSAGELARDIEHFLAGEPIEAKRDSTWYVIRKSLRRHRLAVAVVAAFVLVLAASTVALSIMYQNQSRARQQAEQARDAESEQRQIAQAAEQEQNRVRKEAEEARDQTQVVADFQSSMLGETDAEGMGLAIVDGFEERIRAALAARIEDQAEIDRVIHEWRQRTLKAGPTTVALRVLDEFVLAKATETIEKDFADQPLVRAALQQTVASTYQDIGLYEPAMPLQEAALATRREELGDDHPGTLMSINSVGYLLQLMGKYEEAMTYFREALDANRRVLGDDHPTTLNSINNMGCLLKVSGKLAEAEPHYREALEGRRRVLGNDHPGTLMSINNIGMLLKAMGKPDEAASCQRDALAGFRRVLGDDHPDTLQSIHSMGYLLKSMDKVVEARSYYREALEGKRRVLGDDHPSTLLSIYNLSLLLRDRERFGEAESLAIECLELASGRFGSEHQETIYAIKLLIKVYTAWHEAEPDAGYDVRATEWRAKLPAAERADSLIELGMRLLEDGRHAEAEAPLAECLEIRQEALAEGHWLIFNTMSVLGESLAGQEEFAEAEPLLLKAYEGVKDHPDATDVRKAETLERIVKLYEAWHAAEPDQAYDAKAAQWRAKLPAASRPATQPAAVESSAP